MNIGTFELLVILILALLLYGKRLPEITRALGKGYREFRDNFNGVRKDIERQINEAALEEDISRADKIYGAPEIKESGPPVDNDRSPEK
jgi:Tat protein translocase TatB subunit